MKKVVVCAMLALAGALARPALPCEECQLRKEGTYLGQFTLMGNGTVRSWVKYGKNGKPESIGITLSETALSGLRQDVPPQMPVVEYKLALPKEAKATGFDHISVDWNPKGHIPKGIYDVPHFDIHFYMMTPQERTKISAQGKDLAVSQKAPLAKYMPAGYILPPGTSVPQMGAHALAADAPELRGQPFGTSFIYGFYNGQMNFIEPMVTLSFLLEKKNFSAPVKMPAAFARRGYYPTRYNIAYDAVRAEYSISLDGLALRGPAPAAPKAAAAKTAGRGFAAPKPAVLRRVSTTTRAGAAR